MITQFEGETHRDAIVNHFGLDMEEEESFFDFIGENGYVIDDIPDDVLIHLYDAFNLKEKG